MANDRVYLLCGCQKYHLTLFKYYPISIHAVADIERLDAFAEHWNECEDNGWDAPSDFDLGDGPIGMSVVAENNHWMTVES